MKIPTHLQVAITSWMARLTIVIVNLVAIRFLLPYLGTESYAIYLVLISFTSWCGLIDFGIGFTLQNYISEFIVKKQDYQKYIDSAFKIISCFLIIAFVLIFLLYQPIQFIIFNKYITILKVQSVNIILITLIMFVMLGAVNISTRVYYALRKGTIPNILTLISYVISFVSMIIVINTLNEDNKLLKIILCYTLPQTILIGYLFFKVFKKSISNLFNIDRNITRNILNKSLKFGGITCMVLFAIEVDFFIMIKTVKSLDIVVYNTFVKIFLTSHSIFLGLLNALWPKSAELYHEQKYADLKKFLNRALLFGIILLSLTVIFCFYCKNIIMRIFLPSVKYNFPYYLFLFFMLYFIIKVITDTYSVFLQSFNKLKIFYIYMPIQIILSIYLQYSLSLQYGISGIVLGGIISSFLTGFFILPYTFYKTLSFHRK